MPVPRMHPLMESLMSEGRGHQGEIIPEEDNLALAYEDRLWEMRLNDELASPEVQAFGGRSEPMEKDTDPLNLGEMVPRSEMERLFPGTAGKQTREEGGIVSGMAGTISGIAQFISNLTGSETAQKVADYESEVQQSAAQIGKEPGEKQSLYDMVWSGLGSMGIFAPVGVGAGIAGGVVRGLPWVAKILRVGLPTVLESAAEGGNTTRQLLAQGMTPEQAKKAGGWVFLANLPAVALTNNLGVFADGGSFARRLLGGGYFESLQESGQAVIGKVAEAIGKAPEEVTLFDLWADAKGKLSEAVKDPDTWKQAFVGAVVGGPTSVMIGGSQEQEGKPLVPPDQTPPEATGQSLALDKALEDRAITPSAHRLAKFFLSQVPDADQNTTIEVVDAVRKATKGIVEESGFEWGEQDSYIVAGETLTTPMEQDVLHTTISLYRGADENTVVEEWYHRFWDHLTDGEREAFFPVYEAAATDLPINEWFAKGGTNFFFSRNLDTLAGDQTVFQRVKGALLRLVGRIRGVIGEKLPQALEEAWAEAAGVEPGAGPQEAQQPQPAGGVKTTIQNIYQKGRGLLGKETPAPSHQVKPAPLTEAETLKARKANLQSNLEGLLRIKSKLDAARADAPPPDAAAMTQTLPVEEKYLDNINLFHIKDADTLKATLTLAADRVQQRSRPISRGETLRAANKLGMTIPQLLAGKPPDIPPAVWIASAESLMTSTAAKMRALARRVQEPDATTAQKIAFHQAWRLHYAVQAEVQGLAAETGRALDIFNSVFKPSVAQIKDFDLIVEAMETGNLRGRTSDLARLVLEAKSMRQINKTLKAAARAKPWDMILEYWKAGLLWSPITHVVNIGGSASAIAWFYPTEMTVASILGKARRALGSKAEAIEAAEAMSWYRGLMEGFWDSLVLAGHRLSAGKKQDWLALSNLLKGPTKARIKDAGRAAWNIYREGEPSPAEKSEVRQTKSISSQTLRDMGLLPSAKALEGDALGRAADLIGFGVDLYGEATRGSFRLLGAEDAFFKNWAYSAAARQLAHHQAAQEAIQQDLHGKKRALFIDQRLSEILSNIEEKHPDLHGEARRLGEYLTFTNELTPALKHLQKGLIKIPVLQFFVPFFRTLAQLTKFGIHRTPLMTLAPTFYQDLAAGGVKRDMAIARFTMGGMYFGLAFYLASLGLISGNGPEDYKKRKMMGEVDGWQQWSYRFGQHDRWISYNRLDPVGFVLGLGAQAYEIYHHGQGIASPQDLWNVAMAGILGTYKYTEDRTFMTGYNQIMKAIHPASSAYDEPENIPKHPLTRYLKRQAASFMPFYSLSRSVAREMDPVMRQTQTLFDHFKANIPVLSKSLPPSLDFWGRERPRNGGWLFPDWMSPFHYGAERGDPVDKELARLVDEVGMSVPSLGRYIQKDKITVKLVPEEHNRLIRVFADTLKAKQRINELMATEKYQKASDQLRALKVRERFALLRKQAKAIYLTQTPELRQQFNRESTSMKLRLYGGRKQ